MTTKRFEGAVSMLESSRHGWRMLARDYENNGETSAMMHAIQEAEAMESAIRLLKAAQGVEKKDALSHFDCAWSDNNYKSVCGYKECSEHKNKCPNSKNQIRALLLALPDTETEVKS